MSYSYLKPAGPAGKAGFPRPHLDAFDPRKRRRYRNQGMRRRAYKVVGRARRSMERSALDVDASAFGVSSRALAATSRLLVDGAQRVGEDEGTLLAPVYELTHAVLGEWLDHRAGFSRRTFRRCLDALARVGLIVYRPGKGCRPSVVGLPVLVELGGAKCRRWLARFLASSRAKLRGHNRGEQRARSPVARALVERATGHQADGPCSRIGSPECSLVHVPGEYELAELETIRTAHAEARARCIYPNCAAERHAPADEHAPTCPEHREAETAEERELALATLAAMKARAAKPPASAPQGQEVEKAIRGLSKPQVFQNSTYVIGNGPEPEETHDSGPSAPDFWTALRAAGRQIATLTTRRGERQGHSKRGSGRETCERCEDSGTLPPIGKSPGRECPDCCLNPEAPPLLLLQPSEPLATDPPRGSA
jgi:hypothetical protein